jgi:hypothetical protein
MKQISVISIWILSFIMMVLFAEEPNVIFCLSFIVFLFMSLCVIGCDKESENKKNC